MTRKRGKYKKKVIYDIFYKSSEYTLDEYYKNIFISCSKGKFPKGITYDDESNSISIKKNNKQLNYNLPDQPNILCKVFIDIISTQLNMTNTKYNSQYYGLQKIPIQCTLYDIKDKNTIYRLIYEYSEKQKKIYGFNNNVKKQLISIIYLGLYSKNIDIKSVNIKNYEITNIDNLYFDHDLNKYKFKKINLIPLSKYSSSNSRL